jgi:hypothetical protein
LNPTSASIDDSPLSEDQRAIAEYFASETYAKAKSRRKPIRPARNRLPKWPDRVLSPAVSFFMALTGLAILLVVAGMVAPVLIGSLRSVLDAGSAYVAFSIVDQTLVYPVIVVFTFAVMTPMFWYGSVLARFGLATILVVPGQITLLSCFHWLQPHDGFAKAFTIAVYTMFLIIAAVAVLAQLWSRWTLSHSQPMDAPLAPAGTHNILELTGIAAVNCAIFMSLDTSEMVELLLLFIAIAFLFSLAALSFLIAFLRPHRRNFFAASIAVLFCFAGSFVYAGMHAFDGFGWQGLPRMLPSIVGVSVYGTIVFLAALWLGIWWLRCCGWVCLSKLDEKKVRESEKSEPWGFWFGDSIGQQDAFTRSTNRAR